MKRGKKIVLITVGGLVSLLLIGALFFVGGFFFLLQKGYFPIPESKDFILLYAAGVGSLLLIMIFHFLLRKKYRYFSFGILAGAVLSITLLYNTTADLVWYLRPEPFNSEVWKSDPDKPLEMVYYLTRNDSILIGKTRSEAIDILGTDYIQKYTNDTLVTYRIDYGSISYFQLDLNDSGTIGRVYYTYYDD